MPRKSPWYISAPRFLCGHARSDENKNTRGDCKTCAREQKRRWEAKQRARERRRAWDRDRKRRQAGVFVLDERTLTIEHVTITPKPRIPIPRATVELIESCRPLFERACARSRPRREFHGATMPISAEARS